MTAESTRGRFIVFEGIDGAGKTTQIELLETYLRERGRKVFRTAEPTDSTIGRMLRDALSGRAPRTACELAALFTLDRVSHNVDPENGIGQALARGMDVICDRYYYSTLAYQGSETDAKWVRDMNLNCPEIRRPDLCVFLDLSPEESMARISHRNASREIFETRERLERVRAQFYRVWNELPDENVQIADAARSIEEIQTDIRRMVDRLTVNEA